MHAIALLEVRLVAGSDSIATPPIRISKDIARIVVCTFESYVTCRRCALWIDLRRTRSIFPLINRADKLRSCAFISIDGLNDAY